VRAAVTTMPKARTASLIKAAVRNDYATNKGCAALDFAFCARSFAILDRKFVRSGVSYESIQVRCEGRPERWTRNQPWFTRIQFPRQLASC
jgi:hypothetical protein